MQLNTQIATIGHTFPHYRATKEVELDSDLTEFDEEILEIISVHQPIMAKYIASQLALTHRFTYSISEIESRLFKALSNYVIQDKYFRWLLRYEGMEDQTR